MILLGPLVLAAALAACATPNMEETAAVATEVDLTRQCLEVLGPDPVRALDQTEANLYERMIELCEVKQPSAADQAEFSRLRIVYETEMRQP